MKAIHYLCIILYIENMPYAILIILVVYSKNCETGILLWMDFCLSRQSGILTFRHTTVTHSSLQHFVCFLYFFWNKKAKFSSASLLQEIDSFPFMWLNVIWAKLNCKPLWSSFSSSSVCYLRGVCRGLVTYVASHAGIFELTFVDLLLSESLRILAFNCKTCLALEALVTVKVLPFSPPVQQIVRPHRGFHCILLLALRNP